MMHGRERAEREPRESREEGDWYLLTWSRARRQDVHRAYIKTQAGRTRQSVSMSV